MYNYIIKNICLNLVGEKLPTFSFVKPCYSKIILTLRT